MIKIIGLFIHLRRFEIPIFLAIFLLLLFSTGYAEAYNDKIDDTSENILEVVNQGYRETGDIVKGLRPVVSDTILDSSWYKNAINRFERFVREVKKKPLYRRGGDLVPDVFNRK